MAVVYKSFTCERNEISQRFETAGAFIQVESKKNAAPLVRVTSTFRHVSITRHVFFVTITSLCIQRVRNIIDVVTFI
jgi:hypothetical protein